MSCFTHEKVTDRITRIRDVSGVCMYLVEGSERALLLDTGVGVGSLRAAVSALTDKSVTVVLTHGHVDHACGAGEFDTVYLSAADLPLYAGHSLLPVRQGYVSGAGKMGGDPAVLAAVKPADYLPARAAEDFLPLEGGMTFELGGLTAEVIALPGHTPGSVVVLLREERMLLLGDACNGFTFLFEPDCPTVEQYRQGLLQLKAETDGKYDRTLYSHGTGEGCVDMVDRVIAVCDDILAGNADDMHFRGFDGTPACIAKAMDFSRFCRADGGEGNVVYDPQKVR